ncbi:acyl-CoA thioesterase [Leptolyngbya sp. FACHB-261]|uniref:acyl-CoA thioesterase n=1 Tax=Leptolyngbya sp. FACHB-261 TaxID=2692806 RepID=UPI001685410B|nr:hotdog domain-containing protein [Leptolyngbya sp. FACHB-261]MBD2103553.1 acyl-CoA thioesterase [Leptolyngbya sp. FACHB-261]
MRYSDSLLADGWLRSFRTTVRGAQLNAYGFLFGGQLMAWIDDAAVMFGRCHMEHASVVTKKISEMVFNSPAHQGDIVEVFTRVRREGRTSLTVEVQAFVFNPETPTATNQIVACEMVLVALDEKGRPFAWHERPRTGDWHDQYLAR